MASATGLSAALAALKAHAAAATIAATMVVGGGAAAVAVTTGAVHIPGTHTTHVDASGTPGASGAAARAQACADHNGDAQRLASVYGPMFAGTTSAQKDICALFANSAGGHAFGLGQVEQVLDIAAAIERAGGSTACLTTPLAPASHGKPSNAGKPSFTAPTSSEAATMGIISTIMSDVKAGTPLARLAKNCDVSPRPGAAGAGADNGQSGTHGGGSGA